ncbi:hypothetical protein [Aliivibrio fischeri]|uniref:Gp5/Type VI secretion system Vgr protein OB-fold domain-containing protein n=1 Tax=Aliivibrio fischeri TaxID=668 RepID=A0A510UF59_ALIFS|nr:hypothetical protein [Aliivibrio fischeri]GEK13207.1 hypothetical protein AFI02nite_12430 [Aliivibrio fischeri]
MDDKIAKMIQKHYPEIANGWHCPLWGRITSINETPKDGQLSDPYRPYYCASVKLLTKNGEETSTPILSNIGISGSFSASGGIMQLPTPGAIVSIQFAFGMPDKPYIDKVLPYEISLPSIDIEEIKLQSRQGVQVHLQQDGTISTSTDGAINQHSNESNIKTGNEIKQSQLQKLTINEHSLNEVVGVYELLAYGGLYLVSTRNAELSALGKLSLTSGGDFEEFIYGSRISQIEEKLQISIKDAGSISLDSDGFNVNAKKGKIQIGNDSIDIVKTLHTLIDIVGKLSNTLATHNHGTGVGPSTTPIQTAPISSYSVQLTTLMDKLKPIVK